MEKRFLTTVKHYLKVSIAELASFGSVSVVMLQSVSAGRRSLSDSFFPLVDLYRSVRSCEGLEVALRSPSDADLELLAKMRAKLMREVEKELASVQHQRDALLKEREACLLGLRVCAAHRAGGFALSEEQLLWLSRREKNLRFLLEEKWSLAALLKLDNRVAGLRARKQQLAEQP